MTIPRSRVNSFGVPGPKGPAGVQGPTGPTGPTGPRPPGSYSIEDFGAVAGTGVSGAVRTANTAAIQTAIDTLGGYPNTGLGRGADLWVPPGVFEINDRLNIGGTGDFISGLRLLGVGGRYTSVIKQMDPTKGVLAVTNTTVNTRSVSIEDLTLCGGTIGLECKNEIYNTYKNLVFFQNTLYGLYSPQNSYSRFSGCWFSDITGNCVHVLSGIVWLEGCTFGEASGGLYVDTGTLQLDDCYLFDCADQLGLVNSPMGLGSNVPVIICNSGGTLNIRGGKYIPRPTGADCMFFLANAGSVAINGGEYIFDTNIADFIIDHQANTYGRALMCKPDRINTARTASAMKVYRELSGTAIKARYRSTIDTAIEYHTNVPTVDSAWSDGGQENTTSLRARVAV